MGGSEMVKYLMGLLLVCSSVLFNVAWAKEPVYTRFLSNVAVSGYDTVAYFTEGKPVKGDKAHKVEYQGASWYFKNAENRALFLSEPEKYAPQYGGYCAWAVAQNKTASADPHQWSIVNSRLYLNYDAEIQARWAKDKDKLIQQANKNWPDVLN